MSKLALLRENLLGTNLKVLLPKVLAHPYDRPKNSRENIYLDALSRSVLSFLRNPGIISELRIAIYEKNAHTRSECGSNQVGLVHFLNGLTFPLPTLLLRVLGVPEPMCIISESSY